MIAQRRVPPAGRRAAKRLDGLDAGRKAKRGKEKGPGRAWTPKGREGDAGAKTDCGGVAVRLWGLQSRCNWRCNAIMATARYLGRDRCLRRQRDQI